MKLLIAVALLVVGLSPCHAGFNPFGEGSGQTTEALTEAPTDAPTEAPTEALTEALTEAPTQAPTDATNATTQAPTDATTEAPTDGSVSVVERVDFSYTYSGVEIKIYFNNLLMKNPFYNDGYYYYYYQLFGVPCILNQLVFRNTHTNEVFQAEYTGTCSSYSTNIIQITMDPRDFLRLFENEFIDTTSTTSLEMYTADMLGVPFNLQIQPDEAVEFVLRLNLYYNVGIRYSDYWTDEGILLIHFTAFIDVATVNASKLSLSRPSSYYQRDPNNTVNITGGEVLNQSPGLTLSVAIKLTSNDHDLLASKRICTGSSIYDCYLNTESGFATAYFGAEVYPTRGYTVNKIRRASTDSEPVNTP